jgi:hypothetical protein
MGFGSVWEQGTLMGATWELTLCIWNDNGVLGCLAFRSGVWVLCMYGVTDFYK